MFSETFNIPSLTYVGVLVVRHIGVHAVGEEGQGAIVPDCLPGLQAQVQGPVNNLDSDPKLRVSLLQLTWGQEWSVSNV